MGFTELFRSSMGVRAHRLAAKVHDFKNCFGGVFEILATSAPVVVGEVMDTFWSVCDKGKSCPSLSAGKELGKLSSYLTPEDKKAVARQLREQISCCKRRSQKWGPLPRRRFCDCESFKETFTEDEPAVFQVKDCPPGRVLCSKHKCLRHGGTGQASGTKKIEWSTPACDICANGSTDWAGPIRSAYNKLKRQAKAPMPLIEPLVLADTEDCFGCYKQASDQLRRRHYADIATPEEWARAASLLYRGDLQFLKNPMQSLSISGTDGGPYLEGGNQRGHKDGWNFLPPVGKACRDAVLKWQLQSVNGLEESMLYGTTLDDWKHRRMGTCLHPIASKRIPSSVKKVEAADPEYFLWCVDSLKSSMEEFLDVFYDCASNFDGYLETFMDAEGVFPVAVTGNIRGLDITVSRPLVMPTGSILGNIEDNYVDRIGARLYAEKVYNTFQLGVGIAMAHPDHEEIEDQIDHLENKQGGELMSTPSFIKILKEKKKDVRGKEFQEGAEGRLLRSKDLELDKRDIFLAHTLMENLWTSGVVRKFTKHGPKLTRVCVDLTNQQEVVKYPAKQLQNTSDGVLTAQTFTVLDRPQYDQLNKLAESGWKEAKSVCLNLHVRSYVPVHSNIYAFCVVMWGHSSDAEQASLCGAYLYLGDQEAHVLELPLLCGHIGSSLSDFDAYKRSLVLSTCFYGAKGISAGQNMFGITAVEFTEYLPTSYGGITHERDSWDSMLRNHQGKDKGRFLAGFNVVDAIEAGKGKSLSFPDFNLEPIPRTQPVVREFGQEGMPSMARSQSMRVKTFAQFRGPNIPIGRHVDMRAEALGRTAPSGYGTCEPSISGVVPVTTGRVSTSVDPVLSGFNATADYSWENFLATRLVTLPASAPQGTVLAKIDVLAAIRSTSSATYARWLSQGYVDTDLLLVSHCASNAFSGKTIWFVVDAYNKIPSSITTTMRINIARQLPCYVHVLNDPKTSMHRLNLGELIGYTLYPAQTSYTNPHIYVLQGSDSGLAFSANSTFSVEFYAIGEKRAKGFVEESILTYPISASALANLGPFYLPIQDCKLGDSAAITIPINWAKMQTVSTLRIYSYFSAVLNHFLGIGGKIRMRIQVMSSCFVVAKLRIAIWHRLPSQDDLCRIPYIDIDGTTQDFTLEIMDSFVCSSVFGDSNANIFVMPLGTSIAPEAVESKFEFALSILGFDVVPELCRQISYDYKFAWFMAQVASPAPSASTPFDIPARCCDLSLMGLTITTYTNPFLIMCAASGLHGGTVCLHISWTVNKGVTFGDMIGQFFIGHGFGPKTEHNRGQSVLYNPAENKAIVKLNFGTWTGFAPSRAPTEEYLEWVRLVPWGEWTAISGIMVEVEVLPGFRFLGRSAGPLTS